MVMGKNHEEEGGILMAETGRRLGSKEGEELRQRRQQEEDIYQVATPTPTPPPSNNSRRRKGIPHRAPFGS